MKSQPYLRYVVKHGEFAEHSTSFSKRSAALQFADERKGLVLDLMGKGWNGVKIIASYRRYDR